MITVNFIIVISNVITVGNGINGTIRDIISENFRQEAYSLGWINACVSLCAADKIVD